MHTRHETHQQVDKSDDAVQHSYVARRDGEPGSECDARQMVVDAGTHVVACAGTVCDRGRGRRQLSQPADPRFFWKKNMNVLLRASFTANVAFFLPNLIQEQVCCVCRFLLQGMVLPSMSTYSCPVRECWFMSKYSEAKQTVVKTK